MRKLFNEGNLTTEAIHAVMSEEKPNQKEKIVLRGDRVRQLIPKNIPVSQTEDFVCKALEHYNKFLEFMSHDYVTYNMACEYYRLGIKPVVRMAHEAGAIYKIGKKVLIRRSIFEAYMREQRKI